MQKISEVFVLVEDRPGSIGDLTRIIKKKGLNILGIGVFIDTARLHVDDAQKALAVLQESGYQAELREVLRVVLPNQKGALMELTQKLGNAGINIKYLYGTMEENQKNGVVILEVDQLQLAQNIFKEYPKY